MNIIWDVSDPHSFRIDLINNKIYVLLFSHKGCPFILVWWAVIFQGVWDFLYIKCLRERCSQREVSNFILYVVGAQRNPFDAYASS